MKILFYRLLLPALLFSFFAIDKSQAQTEPPSPTLTSPYNTMYVHLYYLQSDSYRPDLAARTIAPLEDSLQRVKLAIKLKQVFDGKGLNVRLNLLPQDPNYRDTVSQEHFYTPFPDQLPDVYLEKKDSQWRYAAQTVEAIPRLHREVYPLGTDVLLNIFPSSAQRQFLGLAAWQWLGLGLLLLLAWLLHLLLSRLFRPVVRLLARSKHSLPLEDKSMLWRVARLASFLVLIWLASIFLPVLQLPVATMSWMINGLKIAAVMMAVWLALAIVNVVMQYANRYAAGTEQKLDEQLIPILRRMLKIVVVLTGLIYVLQLLDVNVTALIAGVSIGGLALALAAQDTVKNFIGSAMIFFDKPFQIGDWVVASDVEGEVVEVGFRSTRLQTVDSSIITVPNGQVATVAVTNMGIRRYRLFKATLGVMYDTPPERMEKFIGRLRQIIEEHPRTRKDNFLVHFHTFGESSLDIFFRTHLEVSNLADEFAVREELAFSILKLAEEMGVSFAFPTRTVVVENNEKTPT